MVGKIVLFRLCDFIEIVERCFGIENEGVFRLFGEVFFFRVVFIVDVAHYFLQHIFQGDDTLHAAEFVYYNRHVHFLLAEIFEQVVDHACFGHEIHPSHQRLPFKIIVTLANVGKQVFGIEHTLHIVGIFFVNGHA